MGHVEVPTHVDVPKVVEVPTIVEVPTFVNVPKVVEVPTVAKKKCYFGDKYCGAAIKKRHEERLQRSKRLSKASEDSAGRKAKGGTPCLIKAALPIAVVAVGAACLA